MRKLAVISSGTKGIGRATVEKFYMAGFDIVTCARSQADLEALKLELEKPDLGTVHISATDMSKKSDVERFAEIVKSLNQPVDVLLNNTGIFIPGAVHEEAEGSLEQMIETNLYSAYYLTRALIGGMKSAQNGHIFTTGSIAGIQSYANGGSYSISKFALHGFTKALREEMKPHGVRVTSLLAGATYTASWEGVELPEDRFMKASDIADAIFNTNALSKQTVVEEILLRPQLGDI
ncbi:SDR family oxidoreductase [Roseivirga misakiensis]|uniref:Short-chain dehydrogenase n=1 Tax=Roseivirga misakiensis TaxID=1563681 RepID=A0A1E5T1Q5_9BACT|nr:SDR family NAD(P)-dependent oxidoreductase [Roseivirga misakiensis]OEK05289.1 short-chain dehydrogenase [Roseivirga misakiensis]